MSDLIAIASLIVSILIFAYQLHEDRRWRKNDRAISFSNFNADKLKDVISRLSEAFGKAGSIYSLTEPLTNDELQAAIKVSKDKKNKDASHESLESDINYLLSRYEELGLAVIQGVADKGTVVQLYGSTVPHIINVFKNYIEAEREKEHNYLIWANAIKLAYELQEMPEIQADSELRKAKICQAFKALKQIHGRGYDQKPQENCNPTWPE